jgi:hypothetical protein
MKLFQQLLVAPAALGLVAPLAVNAEVNINDVSTYADQVSYEQDVSSSKYSDIVPGDWAYGALKNLSKSYGCVDNNYTQNLNGGLSLTRYEAAALINACLDSGLVARGEGLTAETSRLTNEFGSEMAILKGRVDGLNHQPSDYNAGSFSTTTTLSGGAVFTLGAVDGSTSGESVAHQYAFSADLNTSFTGRDNLYAGVETGNHAAPLQMDSETSGTEFIKLHSLYYTFPVGDSWVVTAGPLFDSDDVIGATTSIYSDAFRLAASPYSNRDTETGPGAGIVWTGETGFVASASVIADDGEGGNTGILTEEGDDVIVLSGGYNGDQWGAGFIYTDTDDADPTASGTSSLKGYGSLALGVYFRPDNLPTVSVVLDTKNPRDQAIVDSTDLMIGFDYPWGAGTASAAFKTTETEGAASLNSYEFYYNYPVNDGLSVQGGLFVEEQAGTAEDHTGAVVEAFFTF